MNEVYRIITRCEELVTWELELEEKNNAKTFLLKEKEKISQITINSQILKGKKMLTFLPAKSAYSEEQLVKFLVQEQLEKEKVEKISLFNTWFNGNCAVVISSKKSIIFGSSYKLWIAIYEPTFGKVEANIKLIKAIKEIQKVKENWEKVIEDFKNTLKNSEHPVVELYNNVYTTSLPSLTKKYKNVRKLKIMLSPQSEPDDYIKSYDVVKTDRKLGTYQHVAVYLGGRKVVHIPDTRNSVRIDDWEIFLKNAKEIKIYHPVIPFKRPELIQKHIDMAIKAKYGRGKYHLLFNNCEHFATMCVYGLGICRQKNLNTLNRVTKRSEYLLHAIKESNKFFESLEKNQEQLEAWVEIPSKK